MIDISVGVCAVGADIVKCMNSQCKISLNIEKYLYEGRHLGLVI